MRFEDWFYNSNRKITPAQDFFSLCEKNQIDYEVIEFIKKTYIQGYMAGLKNKQVADEDHKYIYNMSNSISKKEKLDVIKSTIESKLKNQKEI